MTFASNKNPKLLIALISFAGVATLFADTSLAVAAGGLTVGQTTLATVIGWLTATAVAVATVAFMFVGYRMMFAAAQWKDVAPVFWGAVIIGAAGAIATVVTQ